MPDLTITIPAELAERLASTFGAEGEDLAALVVAHVGNLPAARHRLYLSDDDLEDMLAAVTKSIDPRQNMKPKARKGAVRLLRRLERMGR
jgi:hypothetical protein